MNAVNTTRQPMNKQLGEMIASLIATIESGQFGFDYAIKEYTGQAENEVATAFKSFVREMEMGDSQPTYDDDNIPDLGDKRRAALQNVAHRLNDPDVMAFVNGMIEAQNNHINVVEALRRQAARLG